MRRLSVALPTLSPAARDRWRRSWCRRSTPKAGSRSAWPARRRPPARAAAPPGPRSTPAQQLRQLRGRRPLPAYWKRLSTAHFNVFHLALGDTAAPGYDDLPPRPPPSASPRSSRRSTSETGLLQRFPLADTAEACNGGDGAVDIYLRQPRPRRHARPDDDLPGPLQPRAELTSSSTRTTRRCSMARARSPPDGTRELEGDPRARDRRTCCSSRWTAPAPPATTTSGSTRRPPSGRWTTSTRPGTSRTAATGAAPNYQRSGRLLSRSTCTATTWRPIEKPGLAGNPSMNGYADYIFFQYLARKYDAADDQGGLRRQPKPRRASRRSRSALAPKGGMKHGLAGVRDDALERQASTRTSTTSAGWDGYDFGLAPVLERRAGVPPAHPEARQAEDDRRRPGGRRAESFKMLKNALDRPNGATAGDFYEIQPRSIFYEHLKFTDPTRAARSTSSTRSRSCPSRELHQGPGAA